MILHNRGGSRINAGRKSTWLTSDTQTIRVPVKLVDQILGIAHRLDSGEYIEYDTKSVTPIFDKEQLESIKNELLEDTKLTRGTKDRAVVKKAVQAFIDKLVGLDDPIQIEMPDLISIE
jgi:hypothetical protein